MRKIRPQRVVSGVLYSGCHMLRRGFAQFLVGVERPCVEFLAVRGLIGPSFCNWVCLAFLSVELGWKSFRLDLCDKKGSSGGLISMYCLPLV